MANSFKGSSKGRNLRETDDAGAGKEKSVDKKDNCNLRHSKRGEGGVLVLSRMICRFCKERSRAYSNGTRGPNNEEKKRNPETCSYNGRRRAALSSRGSALFEGKRSDRPGR